MCARELIKWVEINARVIGERGEHFRMHRDDDDDPFVIVSFGGEQIGTGQFCTVDCEIIHSHACPMHRVTYTTRSVVYWRVLAPTIFQVLRSVRIVGSARRGAA